MLRRRQVLKGMAPGGPPAVTRFARALGDDVTRLDRTEPGLNAATPGDARDTALAAVGHAIHQTVTSADIT
ncbi:hypothetical protein [Metallibacterium sp.]|jgi:beta-lactamase class A|uniref:hypothetical protein n=1 Tax=Metallibacterium sp. TaxID=2940281 RepID=UPI0031BA6C73